MTKMIQRSHPDAEKINPILHNIIVERSNKLDKGALMTNWDCFSIPEFISIADYARSLTEQPSKLVDLWGQLYNRGHYQEYHDHREIDWAFVYYVNTPEGSSPLVFDKSEKEVYSREGEVVIFPGWLIHHVPPNQCDGRTVVSGNLSYENNFPNIFIFK